MIFAPLDFGGSHETWIELQVVAVTARLVGPSGGLDVVNFIWSE